MGRGANNCWLVVPPLVCFQGRWVTFAATTITTSGIIYAHNFTLAQEYFEHAPRRVRFYLQMQRYVAQRRTTVGLQVIA
jgi:hypothetical protein